eukprot:3743882-Rhodomonas_salina.2
MQAGSAVRGYSFCRSQNALRQYRTPTSQYARRRAVADDMSVPKCTSVPEGPEMAYVSTGQRVGSV